MFENRRLRMPLWLVFLGLVFGFLLLSVSLMKVRQVEAQVEVNEMVMEGEVKEKEMVMEEEQVAEEEVSYYLPYPGILPDHPMYWMKMIRDRVQLWLTTSDRLRVERLLLYADKRLGAGWALVEGNKTSLGITTLTKAEKYLEQAVSLGASLGEGGEEEKLKERLIKAVKKHKQVLNIVKGLVSPPNGEAGSKEGEMVEQMIKMQVE